MRGSLSAGQLATLVLAITPLASAWPEWLPERDSLIVRQDNGGDSTTAQPSQTASPSASPKASASNPNTFNLNTGTLSDSPSETGKGGSKPTGKGNSTATTKNPKHTQFDPQSPAGGVVMVTPAITDASQLYKIGGDPITWVWNYTNLLGTPTALDVLATCSVASRMYTLTQNMTFASPATFTWDTGAFQSENVATPLLTEQYNLIIYDADSNPTATAEAGYLGVFNSFKFGLYTPKPYTPLGDWSCASCSGARGEIDQRALGFAVTMCVVTVASFTWFVTGLGVAL